MPAATTKMRRFSGIRARRFEANRDGSPDLTMVFRSAAVTLGNGHVLRGRWIQDSHLKLSIHTAIMSRYFIVFHVQVARTNALVETGRLKRAHPRSLTASRTHVDAPRASCTSLGASLSDERRRPVRRGRPRRPPASPSASTPDAPARSPTGGVFGYWFGPPHPRADTSAVFTELVRRIRAGRSKTHSSNRRASTLRERPPGPRHHLRLRRRRRHARRPRRRPSARRAPMSRPAFIPGDRRPGPGGADHHESVYAHSSIPDSPLGGVSRHRRAAPRLAIRWAQPPLRARRGRRRLNELFDRAASTRGARGRERAPPSTTARGGAEARAARDAAARRSVDEGDAGRSRTSRRCSSRRCGRRTSLLRAHGLRLLSARDDSETARDVAFDGASSSRSNTNRHATIRVRGDGSIRACVAREVGNEGAVVRRRRRRVRRLARRRRVRGGRVRVSGRDAWGMERKMNRHR